MEGQKDNYNNVSIVWKVYLYVYVYYSLMHFKTCFNLN